jgi:hypothetical protein
MTHGVEDGMRMVIRGLGLGDCGADSGSGMVKELVLESSGHVDDSGAVFVSKIGSARE